MLFVVLFYSNVMHLLTYAMYGFNNIRNLEDLVAFGKPMYKQYIIHCLDTKPIANILKVSLKYVGHGRRAPF